jgi:hypothetical protein
MNDVVFLSRLRKKKPVSQSFEKMSALSLETTTTGRVATSSRVSFGHQASRQLVSVECFHLYLRALELKLYLYIYIFKKKTGFKFPKLKKDDHHPWNKVMKKICLKSQVAARGDDAKEGATSGQESFW